jgi:ABC-type branched-subunit amino acid transport system ATPase component
VARGGQGLREWHRVSAAAHHEAGVGGRPGGSSIRSLLGGRALRDERKAAAARASALLAELTIEAQAGTLAERLSYGQQKLLSLGRLLAGEGELILLDEPTSGLSPGMVEDFCTRVRALTRAGKTILLIEHNVEIVLRLSDWIVVMHQGTKIAEGRPDEVRNNVTVMHTYLGITS